MHHFSWRNYSKRVNYNYTMTALLKESECIDRMFQGFGTIRRLYGQFVSDRERVCTAKKLDQVENINR
jgi:hypothetical protein